MKLKHRRIKKLRSILAGIKQRCSNPKNPSFHRYGGRGIKNFLTLEDVIFIWDRDKADSLKKPSMDRILNDGNYERDNCRFIEISENVKKRFGLASNEPNKDKSLIFRVYDHEKDYLKARAFDAGVSLSDHVRTLLFPTSTTHYATTNFTGAPYATSINFQSQASQPVRALDQGKSKKQK